MAKEFIGMDPDRVASLQSSLKSQVDALESITTLVSKARLASMSPSTLGIASGAPVLAPHSITTVTGVLATLAAAHASAQSLVGSLTAEIGQQTAASSGVNASYYRAAPGSAAGTTTVDGETEPWWYVLNESVDDGEKAVEPVFTAGDYWKFAWMATSASGIRSVGALEAASDWAISEAPKAFQIADDIASSPVGKGFAVLGAVTSSIKAYQTWTDPKSTTWDKTRDTITAGLAVTGAVLMFTPLAPIGVALTVAAGAWELGTMIYDNRKAIGSFISGAAKSVANADVKVATAAVHAASDVVNAGKSMLGGLTHSLGLGWP